MLKGGVIMDVINAEQARIAEEAGACAVMVRLLTILSWQEKNVSLIELFSFWIDV